MQAPLFLRRVTQAALLASTDLAVVNKFAHLSSTEHFMATRYYSMTSLDV